MLNLFPNDLKSRFCEQLQILANASNNLDHSGPIGFSAQNRADIKKLNFRASSAEPHGSLCRCIPINFSTQAKVPDQKLICPDRNERTRGLSCFQNYAVWKRERTHDSLAIGNFERMIIWTKVTLNAR